MLGRPTLIFEVKKLSNLIQQAKQMRNRFKSKRRSSGNTFVSEIGGEVSLANSLHASG